MSHPPISRTALRKIQSDLRIKEEAANINDIFNIVDIIYNNVLETTENSKDTMYQHEIPYNDPFYKKYMAQIIRRLRTLFPECQIDHVIMTRTYDGKLYDITKIDDIIAPSIKEALNNTYIVIDWS
jgi:hypothetical protein